MQTRLVVLSSAALFLALTGCSGSDTAAPPIAASQGSRAPVSAPAAPQRVDAATFAGVVTSTGVVVLDVRTPEEFAAGHIDGAINDNVEGPDFAARVAALDPAATYAVYCRSGDRSQVAVAAMTQAGINHIYELESGIIGWQEAGLAVTS